MMNGPVAFHEIAMTAVIKSQLEELASHPAWIRYMFGQLTCPPFLGRLLGVEYIDRVVETVTTQKIEVAPGYQLNTAKLPCISIVAAPAENQQFIGRVGTERFARELSPAIYATFNCTSVSGDVLVVSREYGLQTKLWPGVLLTNGKENAQIEYIVDVGKPTIELHLRAALSDPTSPSDWKAVSSARTHLFELAASQDEVSFQILLHTNGTVEYHRLMATLVRICLKRGRDMMDLLGYKEAVVAQAPVIEVTTDSEPEHQTQFTVRASFLEHWIAREIELPDPNPKVEVSLIADPTDTAGGDESVVLDENVT